MENRRNTVAAPSAADASSVLPSEDWRLAREAYKDLQILGMPRTNLLLVGTTGTIRIVLQMLWPELREPVQRWRPGQWLDLPSPGRAATLVFHDVGELARGEQDSVLRWLDEIYGQIRVVSTAATPLWQRVEAGAFNDALYYRLNTVCVDVTSQKN